MSVYIMSCIVFCTIIYLGDFSLVGVFKWCNIFFKKKVYLGKNFILKFIYNMKNFWIDKMVV